MTPTEHQRALRELLALGKSLRAAVDEALSPLAMDWEGYQALDALREPASITELAERMGLSLSAASRRADALVRQGLAAKGRGSDGRTAVVTAAEKGLQQLAQAEKLVSPVVAAAFEKMTRTESEVVGRSVARIRKALEGK